MNLSCNLVQSVWSQQLGAGDESENIWYPPTLQYEEYVAEMAPETSISVKFWKTELKENRSYKGNANQPSNYGDLEALQYAAEAAGDVPVIVSMKMERGMVWSEVEPWQMQSL